MTNNTQRKKLMEEFLAWKNEIREITRDIVERRDFAGGRERLGEMLRAQPVRKFDTALDLRIEDKGGEVQGAVIKALHAIAQKKASVEDIVGIEFDISEHERQQKAENGYSQGIEITCYSRAAYDFLSASDADIRGECDASSTSWQGAFENIVSAGVDGMAEFLDVVHSIDNRGDYHNGIAPQAEGAGPDEFERDPVAYAEVLFNALEAVEYHRFMHDLALRLVLPHDMVVIVGEHDLPHVPRAFYRLKGSQDWPAAPARESEEEKARRRKEEKEREHAEYLENMRKVDELFARMDAEKNRKPSLVRRIFGRAK